MLAGEMEIKEKRKIMLDLQPGVSSSSSSFFSVFKFLLRKEKNIIITN